MIVTIMLPNLGIIIDGSLLYRASLLNACHAP
jgi:hypothetical protein